LRDGLELATALEIVAEARRLEDELAAVLNPGVTIPQVRTQIGTGANAPLVELRVIALTHFMERHFYRGEKRKILPMEPLQ
jgi:hypothetical protein